jgi:hypothetical protein
MRTNVLSRTYPRKGRAFYTRQSSLPLGGGLELLRGFFQSVFNLKLRGLTVKDVQICKANVREDGRQCRYRNCSLVSPYFQLYCACILKNMPSIRSEKLLVLIQEVLGHAVNSFGSDMTSWQDIRRRILSFFRGVRITKSIPPGNTKRARIVDIAPRAGYYEFESNGKMMSIKVSSQKHTSNHLVKKLGRSTISTHIIIF